MEQGSAQASLASVPGTWRVVQAGLATPTFLPCPIPDACLSSANGTCAPGYTGVLCGVCQPGFHLSGSACDACSGKANYALPIALGVVVIAVAVAIYIAQRIETARLVGVGKVLMSYLQVWHMNN